MQLTITTDYAIRLVYYLSAEKDVKNTSVIAKSLGIPASYVQKVVKPLKKVGILEAVEGLQGGYRLAKKSTDITLFDIISATEQTMRINRCLEKDAYCSRFAVSACPVRRAHKIIQEQIEDRLSEVTIAELTGEQAPQKNFSMTNMVVNLKTDQYTVVYVHDSAFGNSFEIEGCFSNAVNRFNEMFVHPAEHEKIKSFLDFEEIKEYFSKGNRERRMHYRQRIDQGYMWMELIVYFSDKYGTEKLLLVANNIQFVQREIEVLDANLAKKTKELEFAYWGGMDFVGTILESYSVDFNHHVKAVQHYTKQLLLKMQELYPEIGLDNKQIFAISNLSRLHDLGKISISEELLNKSTPLSNEEITQMQLHTTIGANMVKRIPKLRNYEHWSEIAYDICKYHHERYDGKGYPEGLIGEEIPIAAQIVGIANEYASLIGKNNTKSYSHTEALRKIQTEERGAFSDRIFHCLKCAGEEVTWEMKIEGS